MSADLASEYLAALPAEVAGPDAGEVAAWLASTQTAAQAAWPQVALDAVVFARHLARHARGDGQWRELEAVDLYLARACADSNPKALALFESRCLADVTKAVLQLGLGAADSDDVLQRVREQLFVRGVAKEPLISRYAGRGSLRAWVRSIAVRTAIKEMRGAARLVSVDEEVFLEFAATTEDPELEPYKQRYREDFRAAFREAVAALSVRQRNLLRHYFLDGLSIDELGALYRVHRATSARWIVDLRAALLDGVRASLAVRLQLGEVELRQLLALVQSQLSLSLARLLQA